MIKLFYYQLKILLKNKSLVFWTLLFPMILGLLFNFAFANLTSGESFEKIDLALVINEENPIALDFFEQNKEEYFNYEVTDLEDAEKLLEEEEINAIVYIDEEISLEINNINMKTSILKQMIDTFNRQKATMINGLELHDDNNINLVTDNYDYTLIYFFSLLGMMIMHGGYFGIAITNSLEANLSKKGARMSMTPTPKWKILTSSLVASFLVIMIEVIIVFSFLNLLLNNALLINTLNLAAIFISSVIAALSLGLFIGVISKELPSKKEAYLTTIVMAGSFLAGMMVITMKYIIKDNIPILGLINPVNMISDAFYEIIFYNNTNLISFPIIRLLLFSLVFISFSFLIIRRKKYDSI